MDGAPSRTCPRCGTPRVGNFRWCRSCQFDFDADRVAGEPTQAAGEDATAPATGPAFVLSPHPTSPPPAAPAETLTESSAAAPIPTPSAAPGARPPVPDPAPIAAASTATTASPPTAASPPFWARIPRRLRLPLAAAGAVLAVLVLALLLIPPRSNSPDAVASAPGSGEPSGGATTAPTRAVAPTPFPPIQLSGTGSDNVEFSIPEGSSGLATILNSGSGAFVVWTVGADGAQNQQLVNVVGPFAGTLLFDESEHSTAFSVESDGNWSIEVKPITAARTWDRSEQLVGDGPDVILVLPPTSADTNTTVRVDGVGDLVVSAYASSGKSQLLNETAPFQGALVLPTGTSLIEVDASDAWSIAPG